MTQATAPDVVADVLMDVRHMPRELAIVKIENDSMMAMAMAKPRNYPAVLADVKSQIETFPSFAREAMYSKPVGKDRVGGQMKYARGLSIRAAEAIRCSMGHNKVRCSVTPIDNDTVKIEATFSDFASGSIWQDEAIVSKLYQTKAWGDKPSRTQRIADDRFYNVTVKAQKSIVVREVILRSMPPGLRSELEALVDYQVDRLLDHSTVQKLVASFANKGVTQQKIEGHLGKSMDALNKDDRKTLLGIWNALEQEETTIAQAFGEDDAPQTQAPTAAKPAASKTDALAEELKGTTPAPDGADVTSEAVADAPVPETKQPSPEPEKVAKPLTQAQLRTNIRAKWLNLNKDEADELAGKHWLEEHGLQTIDGVDKVLGVKPLTALLESLESTETKQSSTA